MGMKETEPSAKPLFPEGTPCEVIDPDGKRMFSGFYVHHRKVVTCFAEDERPENYAHAVFHRGITDWGFPETWTLTEITPPHKIAADERALALALHDGTTWVKQRECTREAAGEGETHWYRCSECRGAIDRWDRYCKHCGAKVVG